MSKSLQRKANPKSNTLTGKKVFVGLSGGVDSSVSAALLQQQGYDVVGLFAFIALEGYQCTAGEDRRDALRAAAHLGIPFKEVDLSASYHQKVFEQSLESYRRGETPNPDALCNREIKFGLLFDYAMMQGADYFATGHYARTKIIEGRTTLFAGKDQGKDQSYFLWAVPEEKLPRTLFPVGALYKSEVRALAKRFKLPNAVRPDSQGLCFIGDISLEDALIKELQPAAGLVLNQAGEAIGSHRGAVLYTIGQRHGFAVQSSSAHDTPHYVIEKNIARNTITVATQPAIEAGALKRGATISLREVNWIGASFSGNCMARLRYRQPLRAASTSIDERGVRVTLKEPELAAVGQSLVLYDGERCLGGGIIDSVN